MNDEYVADERREVVHGETVQHGADANRGFTRRRALQIGAMTALTAMWTRPSLASALTNSTPRYLRRGSYGGLVGQDFTIDGGSYKLLSVGDLAGAANDPSLLGHDEAFALTFQGEPGAFAGGIRNFSHPELGSYSMFAAPVGEAADGTYEVVVDRSVGRPADPPEAPPEPQPLMTEAEKEAAAEELLASTPIAAVAGAPVHARTARKHRVKRKRKARRVKAKHRKLKHPKRRKLRPRTRKHGK